MALASISIHPAAADENARRYLESLKAGQKPDIRPDCGRWSSVIDIVEDAFNRVENRQLTGEIITAVLDTMIKSGKYPGLAELLSSAEPLPPLEIKPQEICPPLPEHLHFPPELAASASPLMDMYIDYSKKVSPEGYEHFHEGGFLSMISTINARRTKIDLKKKDYCSLMIMFVANSTDFAKTTTVSPAENVLMASGLHWLLGSGKTTPQQLVRQMSGIVPSDYSTLAPEVQERIKRRLAFAGQRGWHAGEFGKYVKSMMNGTSAMSDFQGLLLEMDDNKDIYENDTISRNLEQIERPYLSILGCMTPANLRLNARAGAEFWTDGFWARMAFICPPKGKGLDCPMDVGEEPIPPALSAALSRWHYRLGIPMMEVTPILDAKGKETGKFEMEWTKEPTEEKAEFGIGIVDAWKGYRSALKRLSWEAIPEDLKSSYGRLAAKAMRIAALLGSLENNGLIELRHWARAQEIAERWRVSLHELYRQVNTIAVESDAAKLEDEVLRHMKRLAERDQRPSVPELKNYMPRVSRKDIEETLQTLRKAGAVTSEKTAHSTRWQLVEMEPENQRTEEPEMG